MIQSIVVTNDSGESIEMVLADPYKSGFIVESVGGLGPPKFTVNTTELAGSDGATYNSTRATSRNIVFHLRFTSVLGDDGRVIETIEQVRQKTYKYFSIKEPVTVKIITDTRVCETTGYVESNEPDIFSKDESAQISILCPDPYLYANNDMQSLTGLFEFPFSKETDDTTQINFGELTYNIGVNTYYDGDVEAGINVRIHASGPASNITIGNSKTGESMTINTGVFSAITGGTNHMIASDDILLSTVRGNRYIKLLRNGVYYNALSALSKTTEWPMLKKGDNVFVYTSETGYTNLSVSLSSYILYEGI